jgi:DNA-binding SARP family transcriptional activator/tetratricopeptide (TPR) repeat protein
MARKNERSDLVRVRVLGASDLHIGSRKIGLSTEALFALGLYLTVRAGERVPRAEILETFWTDGPDEARRHAMRQMMYRLRQKGLDLDEDGEFLLLGAKRVDSDLNDCLQADWSTRASEDAVEAALSLGPTFSTRLAAPFLEWFDGVRAAVAAQHRKAAQVQIVLGRREGRWQDVERWALAVLKTDPLNEEATLARAESAAMAGSKVTALEILDTYLEEIGEVAPELGRPAALLRKRIAERRADWSLKGPREVELVGRSGLLGAISTVFDVSGPREANCIVLSGPPGIGKTRLAVEALRFAELVGSRVITVRAQKAHLDRPLSSALGVIQALLEQPGALATAPHFLQFLREITSTPTATLNKSLDLFTQTDLVEAFAALSESVSHAVRMSVLIDDAHNVDDASRSLLDRFIRQTSHLRFVWLVTTRTGGGRWAPSESVLTVPPLSTPDAERLAELTLLSSGRAATSAGCRKLAIATGGNPLFLRELAAHGRSSGVGELQIPPTLRDAIRARLQSLDATGVRIVRCIALLGRGATIARCASLVDGGSSTLSAYLESLEQEGIVFLSASHALSLHECWQQEAMAMIPTAAAASLALECARALGDSRSGRLSLEDLWAGATLYSRGGDSKEALNCLLRAADHLSQAGAYEEALTTLAEAETHAQSEWDRISVKRRLAEIGLFRGSIEDSLSALEKTPLVGPPTHAEDRDHFEWAMCVSLRCDALQKLSRRGAREEAALAYVVGSEKYPIAARLHAGLTNARLAAQSRDFKRLAELSAFARSAEAKHQQTIASALIRLIAAAESQCSEDAIEINNSLVRLESAEESRGLRSLSMRFRAVGLRMAGQTDDAIRAAEAAFHEAWALGNFETAANCAEFLTFAFLDENELASAAAWLAKAAEAPNGPATHIRRVGLRHANNRLLQARSNHSAVVDDMLSRLDAQRVDSMLHRRTGELLTYCVSALTLDSTDNLATQIATESAHELARARPNFMLDYSAEMAIRALALVNRDLAHQFAAEYRTARRANFPRPLGRFFERLNENGDFQLSQFSGVQTPVA